MVMLGVDDVRKSVLPFLDNQASSNNPKPGRGINIIMGTPAGPGETRMAIGIKGTAYIGAIPRYVASYPDKNHNDSENFLGDQTYDREGKPMWKHWDSERGFTDMKHPYLLKQGHAPGKAEKMSVFGYRHQPAVIRAEVMATQAYAGPGELPTIKMKVVPRKRGSQAALMLLHSPDVPVEVVSPEQSFL